MSLDRGRRGQTRGPRGAPALPLGLGTAAARGAADEGEAQEGEGLRLAEPARSTSGRRVTVELDRAASQPAPPNFETVPSAQAAAATPGSISPSTTARCSQTDVRQTRLAS